MQIKGITDEDFANYKKPSMFIAFPHCTFKCEKDAGVCCCQNSALAQSPDIEISVEEIVNRYINNPITSAIVMGGLEPFESKSDLISLIKTFREKTLDDIIIFTGFTETEYRAFECALQLEQIAQTNLIIKFGRYIPNQEPHFDEILGVNLASDNQYAKIMC